MNFSPTWLLKLSLFNLVFSGDSQTMEDNVATTSTPPAGLLLISNEPDDRKLAMQIAHDHNLLLEQAVTADSVRLVLSSNPNQLTLWRADNQTAFQQVGEVIPKYVKPHRIVAITDKPLEHYPHLYCSPVFGHHLLRRFKDPALDFYSLLMKAALTDDFHGLARYFPSQTPIKRFKITQPEHKLAATEALHLFLTKQGVRGRIASLVAQAADELMINAMVTAPKIAKKARGATAVPRSTEVVFELAVGSGYFGVCVRDFHGALRKMDVYRSLRKHYDQGTTHVHETTSLGLHGLLQSGLSLLLSSVSQTETEVMIFFPITDNYREFKASMRFLSVIERSSV